MAIDDDNLVVERGIAFHKMIRLITLVTAGHGYLNFMGNEFGHPEWIDFPRQGNFWSYAHARRQWHLVDDPNPKYGLLCAFDNAMLHMARQVNLLGHSGVRLLCRHSDDKVLAFEGAGLVFAFNFHPTQSHSDDHIPARAGKYQMIMDSDTKEFGSHGRLLSNQAHFTLTGSSQSTGQSVLSVYPNVGVCIPNRTAIVLQVKQPVSR